MNEGFNQLINKEFDRRRRFINEQVEVRASIEKAIADSKIPVTDAFPEYKYRRKPNKWESVPRRGWYHR